MKVALKKTTPQTAEVLRPPSARQAEIPSKEDLPNKSLATERLIMINKRQSEVVIFSCVFYFLRITSLILR